MTTMGLSQFSALSLFLQDSLGVEGGVMFDDDIRSEACERDAIGFGVLLKNCGVR